jgi:aminoglycoside 6'-N-acetyltransferase I
MLAFGRELGCQEAWVGTEPDNVAAISLYEARSAPAETFAMYVLRL